MCVKIIPVYQSFKLLKSNCFAVEILFNEDKMASFFSIAKSGFKPGRMSNEDYAEYERILYTWQIENGFWNEITLLTAEQGQITFFRNSFISSEPIDDSTCEISIREDLNTISKFVVKENSDAFKKRLYI